MKKPFELVPGKCYLFAYDPMFFTIAEIEFLTDRMMTNTGVGAIFVPKGALAGVREITKEEADAYLDKPKEGK